MADDARERGGRGNPTPDEAALSARLQHLGKRLDDSRPPDRAPEASPAGSASAMARGVRLSSELVAAVLVGAGLGWLLDKWLGLSPWGMLLFLLLGFVAGILNVMRAAGVIQRSRLDPPGAV